MGSGYNNGPYIHKKDNMKYIFDETGLLERLRAKKKILLMLDYDGTVVPIAKTTDKAVLTDSLRAFYSNLSRRPCVRLAFISGRSLPEIKKMVGIKGIFYAGNHGLEIEGPGTRYVHKKALRLAEELRALFLVLAKALCGFKGVLVEDKSLSISVHFRLADHADEKDIAEEIGAAVDRKLFRIFHGKKVLEIRPAAKWNKGNAVKLISEKSKGYYPVYIGDDRTDEDAFWALKNKGLTVFVGQQKKSAAKYYLKGPNEVRRLAEKICGEK